MIQKYSKRSDKIVSSLAKLTKVESAAVKYEKMTGMPNKFKVPSPIIPKLKKIKLIR